MIHGDAPWRAGQSALRWSRKTKKEGRPTAAYFASFVTFGGSAFYISNKNLWPKAWLIFGMTALVCLCVLSMKNRQQRKEAKEKSSRTVIGAKAEKRSAWLWWRNLLVSTHTVYVMHDRSIPKKYNRGKYTAANLDHLVVTRWGVLNPDTKVRGRNSQHWDADASQFEFSCVQKALNKYEPKSDARIPFIPSMPLWVIWGNVQGTNGGSVVSMPASSFPRWLKKLKPSLSRSEVKALYRYLDKEFPRYSK